LWDTTLVLKSLSIWLQVFWVHLPMENAANRYECLFRAV
jgi:hypothetical protein